MHVKNMRERSDGAKRWVTFMSRLFCFLVHIVPLKVIFDVKSVYFKPKGQGPHGDSMYSTKIFAIRLTYMIMINKVNTCINITVRLK